MPTPAPRELVIVAKPEVGLRATPHGLFSETGTSIDSLKALLFSAGASLQPLFGLSEVLLAQRADTQKFGEAWRATERQLSLFYKVSTADSQLEILAEQLRYLPALHAAYLKPGVELGIYDEDIAIPPEAEAAGIPLAQTTPDLTQFQEYLGPAPGGLNAIAAANDGEGINIIDIEGSWNFTHEDLNENQGGLVRGTHNPNLSWRNHGTAVLGIISGDANRFGVTGLCPKAPIRAVSVFGQPFGNFPKDSGTAAAIHQAADLLGAGEIMLIEMQAPGPPAFRVQQSQVGYIPVEWWPDNLLAIRQAVRRGVIVVEAAANGGVDLDDKIYDQTTPPIGPFPAVWSNPFRRGNADSGAILVGAGAPPPGTNNHDHGFDRSRLAYSDFGSCVDAQGWGFEVTTCGFGGLQHGADENLWYTKRFNGTSSATAMVAGALGCVQGALRKANKPLLTPARARDLLHDTGSPQLDETTGRPELSDPKRLIGKRPDILAMITKALQM